MSACGGERWWERRSGAVRHAEDPRTPDEHDFARVVHSGSFRKLQGKTQILSLGDDDFYRTRLTHSLEVAQVAEGILQHLRGAEPDDAVDISSNSLIRTISLAHDIGHPPFGHGGELALNYCMRDAGGFEGNAQTLRLLARLEVYSIDDGADLTRRTLLGLLKYPAGRKSLACGAVMPRLSPDPTTIRILDGATAKPAKAIYDCDEDVLQWILESLAPADRDEFQAYQVKAGGHGKTLHKSLDCSIMDAADDIAYGVHDLEDAVALGLVDAATFRQFVSPDLCSALLANLRDRPIAGVEASYDGLVSALFGETGCRKRIIGRFVHLCIAGTEIRNVEGFEHPLLARRLAMKAEPKAFLTALRKLISVSVIKAARVQHLDFKGQRMVLACFEALSSAPASLLPVQVFKRFDAANGDPRVICDHLASMTDAGLLRLYDRLFSPRMGTIFDRI